MRIVEWLLGSLLIANVAWADVTGTILAVDQDENGTIRVKTVYTVDGVEVPSQYPIEEGHHYWVTRYDATSFSGMNETEVLDRVLLDVRKFDSHLTQATYLSKANTQLLTTDTIKSLVGKTVTQSSASLLLDTNSDGILDTEWTVKTDGTRTEQPYVP